MFARLGSASWGTAFLGRPLVAATGGGSRAGADACPRSLTPDTEDLVVTNSSIALRTSDVEFHEHFGPIVRRSNVASDDLFRVDRHGGCESTAAEKCP
ncbi:hypothetical protein MHU86_18827 [Fragilaria crotonensis]|nr:hypothetical protein MHU86_18827 [Fragilaria crotonensis]